MKVGEQIRSYRKKLNLTQEQVAEYLGVSTPAVNKWEKGNTYPDIQLLPALARLLKIDMNELFRFKEELTEFEIGQFADRLSEVSMENLDSGFEMAKQKIKEYPHCGPLIYASATILKGALTLMQTDEKEKFRYETLITEWLERAADSEDEKVRISAVYMLAGEYMRKQKYEEAKNFLDKIPETTIDTSVMRANLIMYLEDADTAAAFLEGRLLQAAGNIQAYLYKLIEIEGKTENYKKAEEIADITAKMTMLLGLWNYGAVVPHLLAALDRKDEQQSVKLIQKTLHEARIPWDMGASPLYYRCAEAMNNKPFTDIGERYVHAFISEIETEKEYEFLRGNRELEKILEEYKR